MAKLCAGSISLVGVWGKVEVVSVSYSGQGFSPRGEKGRFVLPPQFRKSVKDSSGGARILCLAKHERWNCLTGFGLSRREALDAQIDREERVAIETGREFDRDMRQIQLFGFSEVPFDDSGRFVMPDYLAGIGKVEGALYFHGAGGFFTLWNPEELARMGTGFESAQAACVALAKEAGARK